MHTLDTRGIQLFDPGCPTRWDGNRCIDYFASDRQVTCPQVLDHYVADHYIVQANLLCSNRSISAYETCPAVSLPVEERGKIDRKRWDDLFKKSWGEIFFPFTFTKDVDTDWEILNESCFNALLNACQEACPEALASLPPSLTRKGKPCKVVLRRKNLLASKPDGDNTSYRERSLSNLLARIRKYQRQVLHDPAKGDPALWSRILRSPHFDPQCGL